MSGKLVDNPTINRRGEMRSGIERCLAPRERIEISGTPIPSVQIMTLLLDLLSINK